MAQSTGLLRTEKDWENFFQKAGIREDTSKTYAKLFKNNHVTELLLPDLTKVHLSDLGITVIGDILIILWQAKKSSSNNTIETTTKSPAFTLKPPAAKLLLITSDMTYLQFRKFRIDWEVFKTTTAIPMDQITSQLYSSCDESVQNGIINPVRNVFRLSEANILRELETIVTQKSNPSVHRTAFSSITQKDGESIKDFIVRLKSAVLDCEFTCPSCSFGLLPINVKDQFIRRLAKDVLQTDILAKANQLKSLENIVKHAEAFEAAIQDQAKLQDSAEIIMAARTSDYQWSKIKQIRPSDIIKQQKPCAGCGSLSHGSGSRSTKCPAWW